MFETIACNLFHCVLWTVDSATFSTVHSQKNTFHCQFDSVPLPDMFGIGRASTIFKYDRGPLSKLLEL